MPEGALRGHPPALILLETRIEVNILDQVLFSETKIHDRLTLSTLWPDHGGRTPAMCRNTTPVASHHLTSA